MGRKKRRKFPIFLAIIILGIIVFGVMLKWNSGYTQSVSGSTDVYDKFKDAVISGGTVSLSSDDINSIISKSFESQTHKGVTIKNIYVNMDQNKLDIKIPVAVKGQNFLVSSRGSVALKDGCAAYLPDSFKIGAIPLSKSFVLSKLKAMYSSKFTIETDGIYINKSAVPLTINSIEIKDGKLNVGVEKLKLGSREASKMVDQLSNAMKNLNPSDKAKVEAAIKSLENNPSLLNDIKNQLNSVSSNEVKQIINNPNGGNNNNSSSSGVKKLDADLAARLSKELSVVATKTSDAAEKELINNMKSQVDSGTIDSSSIKASFKSLNKTQQVQVYTLLLINTNEQDANEIRNIFNLK